MTDDKAQISGEYLLLTGILIFVLMISTVFIATEQELNTAVAAARNGANEGASSSAGAIYTKDAYDDYSASKDTLLIPYSVSIVNISYTNLGHDELYGKEKIQFKVYATSPKDFSKKDRDSIGDRINYNLRKSLAASFNTTSSTNKLYNPVFSPHYVFTTANVKWV